MMGEDPTDQLAQLRIGQWSVHRHTDDVMAQIEAAVGHPPRRLGRPTQPIRQHRDVADPRRHSAADLVHADAARQPDDLAGVADDGRTFERQDRQILGLQTPRIGRLRAAGGVL